MRTVLADGRGGLGTVTSLLVVAAPVRHMAAKAAMVAVTPTASEQVEVETTEMPKKEAEVHKAAVTALLHAAAVVAAAVVPIVAMAAVTAVTPTAAVVALSHAAAMAAAAVVPMVALAVTPTAAEQVEVETTEVPRKEAEVHKAAMTALLHAAAMAAAAVVPIVAMAAVTAVMPMLHAARRGAATSSAVVPKKVAEVEPDTLLRS